MCVYICVYVWTDKVLERSNLKSPCLDTPYSFYFGHLELCIYIFPQTLYYAWYLCFNWPIDNLETLTEFEK